MALVTGTSTVMDAIYTRKTAREGEMEGQPCRPKAFAMLGRHSLTIPMGMMEYLGQGEAKKQTEKERGKHFVSDHRNKWHTTEKNKTMTPEVWVTWGYKWGTWIPCSPPYSEAHSIWRISFRNDVWRIIQKTASPLRSTKLRQKYEFTPTSGQQNQKLTVNELRFAWS